MDAEALSGLNATCMPTRGNPDLKRDDAHPPQKASSVPGSTNGFAAINIGGGTYTAVESGISWSLATSKK
jgi:hypothetical protein